MLLKGREKPDAAENEDPNISAVRLRARYTETVSRLSSLKSRLPADAVATLAGEVLSRVTRHAGTNALPIGRINALALALIDEDPDLCLQMVLDLQAEGKSVETLYLDYLAVAARRLGELWETDPGMSFSQLCPWERPCILRPPARHPTRALIDHPGNPFRMPAQPFFAARARRSEHIPWGLSDLAAVPLFAVRGWEVDSP